jgi:hypothetical protein
MGFRITCDRCGAQCEKMDGWKIWEKRELAAQMEETGLIVPRDYIKLYSRLTICPACSTAFEAFTPPTSPPPDGRVSGCRCDLR